MAFGQTGFVLADGYPTGGWHSGLDDDGNPAQLSDDLGPSGYGGIGFAGASSGGTIQYHFTWAGSGAPPEMVVLTVTSYA